MWKPHALFAAPPCPCPHPHCLTERGRKCSVSVMKSENKTNNIQKLGSWVYTRSQVGFRCECKLPVSDLKLAFVSESVLKHRLLGSTTQSFGLSGVGGPEHLTFWPHTGDRDAAGPVPRSRTTALITCCFWVILGNSFVSCFKKQKGYLKESFYLSSFEKGISKMLFMYFVCFCGTVWVAR